MLAVLQRWLCPATCRQPGFWAQKGLLHHTGVADFCITGLFAFQDYNCELGACLLHLKDHEDPSTLARMQTLALEALNLTGRTMLKPANHRAIVESRLDDATAVSHKPGKAFYLSVLVCVCHFKQSLFCAAWSFCHQLALLSTAAMRNAQNAPMLIAWLALHHAVKLVIAWLWQQQLQRQHCQKHWLPIDVASCCMEAWDMHVWEVCCVECQSSVVTPEEARQTSHTLQSFMLQTTSYPLQAVFNLSEAQAQDLMFMRCLNLTRRVTLSTERKALLQAMAASEAEGLRNRSDNLSCLSQLATKLQQNTADDRLVYYRLARALYRGVRPVSLHKAQ